MQFDFAADGVSCLLQFLITAFLLLKLNCEELIFAQAIWRHGDRNPIHVIPTDKENGPETWINGLGELTKVGISGHYKLGEALKKRYNNFLDPCNLNNEMRLISTDVNRTIMSAEIVHSAMINPQCYTNKKLSDTQNDDDLLNLWAPFPVHTMPVEFDYTLGEAQCPVADQLYETYIETSAEIKELESKNKPFLEFLSNATGINIGFLNISNVMDTLLITKLHNDSHKMPKWVDNVTYNVGYKLWNESSYLWAKNLTVTRLRIGAFLLRIVDIFNQKISNVNNYLSKVKLHGYSVHDSTIINLLTLIGAHEYQEFKLPPYSICYLFELWRNEEKHYIKMVVLENPNIDDSFVELRLPGCPPLPNKCLFDHFVLRNQQFFVKDPYLECQLKFMVGNTVILAVVASVLTTLMFGSFLLIGLIINHVTSDRRRYDGYYRVQLDNMADKFIGEKMAPYKNNNRHGRKKLDARGDNILAQKTDEEVEFSESE